MTNTEMLTLFGLAMLALALAAILVDWISRPTRRRFVPKIYRYPTELAPAPDPTRTAWSDANFIVPDNPPPGEPLHFSDGSTEWTGSAFLIPENPEHPLVATMGLDQELEPEEPEVLVEEIIDEPVVKPQPAAAALPDRSQGWSPGQFVFNLTRSGDEPSGEVVKRRFWKNVSMSDHRGAFGQSNEIRVAEGKTPIRINPRTGRKESMQLVGTDFVDGAGRPPRPTWPGVATDPFGAS